MRAFFDRLFGRAPLRNRISALEYRIRALEQEAETLRFQNAGLQQQVSHAAGATGSMASFTREMEVKTAAIRLSFAEERRRNCRTPGYQIIPEDWWFSQGRPAIKDKALARLQNSPELSTSAAIIEQLILLEQPTQQPQLHESSH